MIQPLGVGDATRRTVDVVGRDVVQDPSGVPSLDHELRHEGHVHENHALSCGLMLRLPVGEPVHAAPGKLLHLGLHPFRGEPVRPLPPADIPEVGATGR